MSVRSAAASFAKRASKPHPAKPTFSVAQMSVLPKMSRPRTEIHAIACAFGSTMTQIHAPRMQTTWLIAQVRSQFSACCTCASSNLISKRRWLTFRAHLNKRQQACRTTKQTENAMISVLPFPLQWMPLRRGSEHSSSSLLWSLSWSSTRGAWSAGLV